MDRSGQGTSQPVQRGPGSGRAFLSTRPPAGWSRGRLWGWKGTPAGWALPFLVWQYLDLLLCVLVHFARADQLGPIGGPVGLDVLPVLSDVGPGPHAADASDVDIHDSTEGIAPPSKDTHTLSTSTAFRVDVWAGLGLTKVCSCGGQRPRAETSCRGCSSPCSRPTPASPAWSGTNGTARDHPEKRPRDKGQRVKDQRDKQKSSE